MVFNQKWTEDQKHTLSPMVVRYGHRIRRITHLALFLLQPVIPVLVLEWLPLTCQHLRCRRKHSDQCGCLSIFKCCSGEVAGYDCVHTAEGLYPVSSASVIICLSKLFGGLLNTHCVLCKKCTVGFTYAIVNFHSSRVPTSVWIVSHHWPRTLKGAVR